MENSSCCRPFLRGPAGGSISQPCPPDSGLLCDLLWSDPDKDVQGWGENDRGVSFTFGADVVSKFLNRHDLDLICRAHQVGFTLPTSTSPRIACSFLFRLKTEPEKTEDGLVFRFLCTKRKWKNWRMEV